MLLDASNYEDYIDLNPVISKNNVEKITYALNGNAIELRLIDVRTYGGQIRLYIDAEGKPIDTGSTTTPMRIKRPFRLAPSSAYVLYVHLKLKKLPDNIIAHIIPTKRMAEIGLIFTDMYIEEGEICIPVMPMRMIESIEYFPIALLTFVPREIDDEIFNHEKVEVKVITGDNTNADVNANVLKTENIKTDVDKDKKINKPKSVKPKNSNGVKSAKNSSIRK